MGSFISLTPWAREAIEPDELAGIHARAAALGAYISVTGGSPRGPWTVYATNASVRAGAQLVPGSLAVAIGAVLDDFRAQTAEASAELERMLA